MTASASRPRGRLALLGLVLAALVGFVLLVTDGSPAVPEQRAATGDQVAAVQELARAARVSRQTGEPVTLTLDNGDLTALSAMASQGVSPARVQVQIADGVLTVKASHALPMRWLNLRAEASGESQGMPDWRVHVGALPLPGWLSQWALDQVQARYLSEDSGLPPLDTMLRRMTIGPASLAAEVRLPDGSLLAHAVATGTPALDQSAVAALYCQLVQAQRADPAPSLATQLKRALGKVQATQQDHRVALAAVALIATDPKLLPLAGKDSALAACVPSAALPAVTLQGRADWAMHWALSAALEVTTGKRVGTLIGEWKELADTRPGAALQVAGEPSGFSFVDLASDRAGLFTARQLTDPARLLPARARLLDGDEDDLLPPAVLELNDGLTDAEFAARYGALDDPRYAAKVAEIDAMLRRGGID